MTPFALHLIEDHPLAGVAAAHCRDHDVPLVGGVACGRCWEQAIRDDERFAVENDLPRELTVDPEDIDEVAVDRVCQGEALTLTVAERSVAIRRLRATGLPITAIAERLHLNHRTVNRALGEVDQRVRRVELVVPVPASARDVGEVAA